MSYKEVGSRFKVNFKSSASELNYNMLSQNIQASNIKSPLANAINK